MPASPVPSLPMYFPPSTTGFDLPTAQTCAALVVIAYQQFTVWSDLGYPPEASFASNTAWQAGGPAGVSYSAPIWSRFKILELPFTEPFGFVAWKGSDVYVVFRGTMTKADEVIDAEIDPTLFTLVSGYGQVHVGFWKVYNGLRADLLAAIAPQTQASRVLFMGHSMGGGLSSLAAADIPINAPPSKAATSWQYSFASPRAGDLTFAAAMNGSPVTTFRIVNTEDVVPDVPPAVTGSILYQHFGSPVDFSAQYRSIGGNHSMTDSYNYAINHPQQPLNPNPKPLQNVLTGKGVGTGSLPASLVVAPQ